MRRDDMMMTDLENVVLEYPVTFNSAYEMVKGCKERRMVAESDGTKSKTIRRKRRATLN